MIGLVVATLAFIAIGLLEGVPLWHMRAWRPLIAVTLLLGAAFSLSLLLAIDYPAPSPIPWLEAVFAPVLPILPGE